MAFDGSNNISASSLVTFTPGVTVGATFGTTQTGSISSDVRKTGTITSKVNQTGTITTLSSSLASFLQTSAAASYTLPIFGLKHFE